jgi:transcriptional regulator with XRE-family HTH domain
MDRKIFAAMLAQKKKTQKEIAEELNMTPQRLSDMLSGRLKGWKYRSKICRYFDISENILFPTD